MRVLDFSVIMYYLFLKKYKEKGLEAAIFLLTLPSTLYLVAIVNYLTQIVLQRHNNIFFYPIWIGLIILSIAFTINKLLKVQYLTKHDYIESNAKAYGSLPLKTLTMLFAVIYYLFSAFVFFYSLKFLPR